MGHWELHKKDISTFRGIWPVGKLIVSKEKLYALDYVEKIKIAYDPKTPVSVINALKQDKDNSVSLAAHQRPRVISGDLQNPFGE